MRKGREVEIGRENMNSKILRVPELQWEHTNTSLLFFFLFPFILFGHDTILEDVRLMD